MLSLGCVDVKADRNTGGSIYVGKYATYECYYRYRDQSDNYKGVHRLTIAIYDRRGASFNIINEVIDLYGEKFSEYLAGIIDQIKCHKAADAVDIYQPEWDIEIQRKSSYNALMYAVDQCNPAEWKDDELLFNMSTKFNNQQIDAKKWL